MTIKIKEIYFITMNTIRLFAIISICLLFTNCEPLKAPTVVLKEKTAGYKYIFLTPTTSLTSSAGGIYGNKYAIYGSSVSKSVNPNDVISGILIKGGFIRLNELNPELLDKTLIVNYGESGSRTRGLGTTMEVTIQFISAKTNSLVCSCTAEGQGATEADDIRQAITRCLYSFSEKKN